MNDNIITPFEWFFLFLLVLITLMSLYQAWVNLIFGKVSRYSIDAILVLLFLKFGNEKARKQVKAFTKNTNRILLFGLYALLTFFGGIYGIIRWLERLTK